MQPVTMAKTKPQTKPSKLGFNSSSTGSLMAEGELAEAGWKQSGAKTRVIRQGVKTLQNLIGLKKEEPQISSHQKVLDGMSQECYLGRRERER